MSSRAQARSNEHYVEHICEERRRSSEMCVVDSGNDGLIFGIAPLMISDWQLTPCTLIPSSYAMLSWQMRGWTLDEIKQVVISCYCVYDG